MARFAIGDVVKPKAEWANDPNRIPSGRVREIARFGNGQALYVEGEKRAFCDYVFDRAEVT